MEKQNNENGNVTKFRDAMNAHAEKVCGVPDAFSIEQAADMLKTWTRQNGGNEDMAVAHMCELAYGFENIAFKDAMQIIDDRIRKSVEAHGTALRSEKTTKSTMADAVDILVRHWKDFNEHEKIAIADMVLALGKYNSTNCDS